MATLRSKNSDVYMKWKIVGEVKLGPYAEAVHMKCTHLHQMWYEFIIVVGSVFGTRSMSEYSDSA